MRILYLYLYLKALGRNCQRCTGVHRLTNDKCLSTENYHSLQAGIICSKLFEAALRRAVYPGHWGSSATVDRNLSNFCLKVDRSTSFKFLSDLGRELKSFGPFTQKLPSLSCCTSADAVLIGFGTRQNLPCLIEDLDLIPLSPTLGTMF